jgi:hypothetical protein
MYLEIHLEDHVEGKIIEERQMIMALQIYRLQISSSTTELRGRDEAAASEFRVMASESGPTTLSNPASCSHREMKRYSLTRNYRIINETRQVNPSLCSE